MSIIVEKAESYRTCNSCSSNNNVVNITALLKFHNGTQGSQIALCEECAKKLLIQLQERFG